MRVARPSRPGQIHSRCLALGRKKDNSSRRSRASMDPRHSEKTRTQMEPKKIGRRSNNFSRNSCHSDPHELAKLLNRTWTSDRRLQLHHARDPTVRVTCKTRPLVSARYQRSTYCPTSRPTMAMRPVPSVYQIATNSGESSMQCIAKTVAPKAPARRPAAAPATAGDIGAP